jgi:hypothetical protein
MRIHEKTEDREPDPARSYERAKPEKEAGMGRLDNDAATPTDRPDQPEAAVRNIHPPRQLNADDQVVDVRSGANPGDAGIRNPLLEHPQLDNPLLDEVPLGEDLMPSDIHDPQKKRHPRKEGKGGTP